jgi:methyl acetate hydrolase
MGAIDPAAIDQSLRDAVTSGAVPHVAAIAADRDGLIYQGAAGPRDVDEDGQVTADTLFRIMSMTKLPCTVTALQQVEQGNLDLDAPVAEYCPRFADLQVLTGFDEDTPRLVAGSRASFDAPLLTDPDERFLYGFNVDWLGQVVEAVTGTGLDVAIKEGVTGPLGMDQTTFSIDDGQRANCTPVHVKGEDGVWVAIGEVMNPNPDWWSGGHGLYGPPSDYIKLQRALLRGGELDGTRILSQATVDAAFTNQIDDLDFPAELVPGRGCATPTSGSTRPPASAARSTATSCRSSHQRPWPCTTTSSEPCTQRCKPSGRVRSR